MSFEIEGYVPPSKEVALEQGVTFDYEMPFGVITIRSRMAGRENTKFRLAMQNHLQWSERQKSLGNSQSKAADEKFAGMVHDTLVISWKTTIKKKGGASIEATRENFIALMTSQACMKVLDVYVRDASDESNFRAVSAEEEAGNSLELSDGSSDGQTRKNGSEK